MEMIFCVLTGHGSCTRIKTPGGFQKFYSDLWVLRSVALCVCVCVSVLAVESWFTESLLRYVVLIWHLACHYWNDCFFCASHGDWVGCSSDKWVALVISILPTDRRGGRGGENWSGEGSIRNLSSFICRSCRHPFLLCSSLCVLVSSSLLLVLVSFFYFSSLLFFLYQGCFWKKDSESDWSYSWSPLGQHCTHTSAHTNTESPVSLLWQRLQTVSNQFNTWAAEDMHW